MNRQGPDTGTQYRTAIFTTSDEQAEIAKKIRDEVQEAHYPGQKIATTIEPAEKWWDAEECVLPSSQTIWRAELIACPAATTSNVRRRFFSSISSSPRVRQTVPEQC